MNKDGVITIRPYSPEEELSQDFYSLAAQSFSQGAPWTLQQYTDTLADRQLKFFVAEAQGMLIGYLGGNVLFDEAEIYSLAVDPSFQKNKVATRLVLAFKTYCKMQGVKDIFLEVRQSNIPARTFYKKLAFEEIGSRTNYYTHPTEDAVLMKCTIGKLEEHV